MMKILMFIVGFAAMCMLAGCRSVPAKPLPSQPRDVPLPSRATPSAAEPQVDLTDRSDLTDYLRYAFVRSPDVKAAFERWKAAQERIPQAQSLDNPSLSFEYFTKQISNRYQVSLTQEFPAFGTLGLRKQSASDVAEAARQNFEVQRLLLFQRVVKAFQEYHYLARATQVTDESHQLLADLEQVITRRYKVGLAPFSDLIKTQVEKARVASELDSLRDERTARSAALAALLNLPMQDVLPWPSFSPSTAVKLDVNVLDNRLAELNPELKAATAILASTAYQEKLAHKSGLPTFMLGASWMVMPGMGSGGDESDLGLMAGISLPLWRGKYRAEVREAIAMHRAASHELDNRLDSLKAELRLAVFKARDARRRVELFSGSLIPKATQALEVAKQEYSSGMSGFMTLIDAERTWLEFKLMLERAQVDREIALGEIRYCIGQHDIELEQDTPAKQAPNGPGGLDEQH